MRVAAPGRTMAAMENHLDRPEGVETPPGRRQRPSAGGILLGALVAAVFAALVAVAAILSFDVNPAGPVIVTVAAIVLGSYSYRHLREITLKSAAVGLIVGGIAAILLWPFFDVS